MGIRFFCPHCEARLNVKSSQAGQAGVCPDCNGVIDVPDESLLPGMPRLPNQRFYLEDDGQGDGSSQMLDMDDQATMDGVVAGQTNPRENPELPAISVAPVFATAGKSTSGIFMLDRPSPPPEFGKVDPIKAELAKVWYFRSKLIGERGPLKAKIMQQHVDNGDVTVGCMVWREDWEDWVKAEAAFPHLAGQAKALDSLQGQADSSVGESNVLTAKSPFKKKAVFYAAMVAGLALLILLTCVVLMILPR